MKIVLTGGAGFIGSCLLKTLNNYSISDIIVVDNVSTSEKWRNLRGKTFSEYINKADFLDRLNSLKGVDAVVHLGACSSTTEADFDYLWRNNVEYSKALFTFCAQKKIPFIYASSAATYGDGSAGFKDGTDIAALRPLNRYGFSKQAFDLWVNSQANRPPQVVGLKFFNVYGPNEYHKAGMYSMVYQGYRQAVESGKIKLFRSTAASIPNGGQSRDFVYVTDVCETIMWFLEHGEVSGLFNVGTGKARTFNDLARCIFNAAGIAENIEYIDMPQNLTKQYQSFTQADMRRLRRAGYDLPFTSLEDGVKDYISNFLADGEYY